MSLSGPAFRSLRRLQRPKVVKDLGLLPDQAAQLVFQALSY